MNRSRLIHWLCLCVLIALMLASLRWAVLIGVGSTWHARPTPGWAVTLASSKGAFAIVWYRGSRPYISNAQNDQHLLGSPSSAVHVTWMWAQPFGFGIYGQYTYRRFAGFQYYAHWTGTAIGYPYSECAVVVPYWFVFTVWLTPFLYAWRRRRRSALLLQRRLCPTCGYDVRATPHRCPECGTAFPAKATGLAEAVHGAVNG